MNHYLNLSGERVTVWRNETPGSAFWCRTQALVRAKEADAVIAYAPYTEEQRTQLMTESFVVTSHRNPVSYLN